MRGMTISLSVGRGGVTVYTYMNAVMRRWNSKDELEFRGGPNKSWHKPLEANSSLAINVTLSFISFGGGNVAVVYKTLRVKKQQESGITH